jgi:transcriptional regulator with XRE-family HTH domain
MKQPELGKKIAELRKEKGLTQEELVDRCNISVRTLQRIETGEVTPRIYTVKTILAALESDLNKISENETGFAERLLIFFKSIFVIRLDPDGPSDQITRQLNISWIFGLIYFVAGFIEAPAEYFMYEENRLIYSNTFYIITKIIVLISFIFFQRGFILIGSLFKNYLLKIISFLLIFSLTVAIGYDIASLYSDGIEREFVMGAEALTFGGIGIVFGVSLFRLRRIVGMAADFAGIFEIIAGCFLLTIILSFIGLILYIPAEIFKIVILYRAMELIKAKQKSSGIDVQNDTN